MRDREPFALADRLQCLVPLQADEHAILLLDAEGVIVAWLAGAERIFGYTAHETVGKRHDFLFSPEDAEKEMPDFEIRAAVENGHAEDDRWMVRKDGMRFWATGVLSPLRDGDRQLLGFCKILRNRTDLKGQIESLENRIANLEKADERKNAFIATLGHELRNPLGSLVNAFEILKMTGPASADTAFAASTIQRQIDAMRRLIDDLLDMARIETGKVHLNRRLVNLNNIVNAAVEVCRPSIEERTHELRLIVPEVPLTVLADADRLQQVFVNLLQNAAKYTEYGGIIWCKAYVEGNEAVVKVQDTGIGISADVLPRIFDLFTQAEFASSRGGLGIGLSVVKDLVSLHGGNVQVRSDGIGKGSEFAVRLPLAGPDEHGVDAPNALRQ